MFDNGGKMKTINVMLIVILGLLLVVPSLADDQKKDDEQQKMMAVWMAYATPGEGHKFLEKQVGEWEVVSKMWEKPGQEPTVTKGPAVGKMILGGRYLKISYSGTVMGMPFEGLCLYAYENHLKKYLSIWLDNMGTGIMSSIGTLDESGMVLTEYAEVNNIFTGAKEKAKTVITFINADKFLMEMYMVGPEGEFKSLEVTHIRKK
jgi:hypothetical protein